jgi:excinuclease ABC subunit B
MDTYKLHLPYAPAGDQTKAIEELVQERPSISTLLGVTGSGKTFTVANVITRQNKPVIVIAPNKTLAAQWYEELSLFFPQNKVCYFVSYYDYYQPESYLPAQDIYVPKETVINSEIERLRVEATASVINRNDTIIVASVSCIYSLGNPTDYKNLAFKIKIGQTISRNDLIRHLIFIQYARNDMAQQSGTFAVRGNTIEIILPYQKEKLRIEMWGDAIELLQWVSKENNTVLLDLDNTIIFPAKHFVTTQEKKDAAIAGIKAELNSWWPHLKNPLYQERIKQRVSHDIELLQQVGFCSGIENYSAHFDARPVGQAPHCLFDFLGDDFLLVIDESHMTIPQLRAMYHGDRSRKSPLIDFGFRLPSARENRPLMFEEIEKYFKDVIFVSATPGDYELRMSQKVVQQIIRPTGLVDPIVTVHPREGQIQHLIEEIKVTKEKGFRSLVMVMTKKLAEQMAHYLEEQQIQGCYLHSEIKTPARTELLQKLRLGVFDCLVGVNLLREGLDLPEVAFVAIMDADLESFLRDKRSLIQIIGRAARNTESRVVLYADKITQSMRSAMDETNRRRSLQELYNHEHAIVPQTVRREVTKSISNMQAAIAAASRAKKSKKEQQLEPKDTVVKILELERQMMEAAEVFDFERAIALRAEWHTLKKLEIKK